jgi:hypothetical protein
MLLASGFRLRNEFSRLLFETNWTGAVDLKQRHRDVHRWFDGLPVYNTPEGTYPPASFVILWPLLGWLSFPAVRWFWAATAVLALAWLIFLIVRESRADTKEEKLFIALFPLSIYATSAAIGNGQLITHLLPAVLAGMLLVRRTGWQNQLLAAILFVVGLTKPSLSAPFFCILLLAAATYRPAIFTVIIYLVLTVFASLFQPSGLATLARDWLYRGSATATHGGYANVHTWLSGLGLQSWMLPASCVCLLALGVWIYLHRNADHWLLIGVAALTARFWMYHRLYDDMLIVLPFVALFRIVKESYSKAAMLALVLLWMGALAPARLLVTPRWDLLFEIAQTGIWLFALACLVFEARRRDTMKPRRGDGMKRGAQARSL